MNMKLSVVMLAGMLSAGAALGEDVIGPVMKDAKKGAAEGVAAGEGTVKKDAPPVVAPIVSPDASNAVDTDELVKRLTGEEKDNGGGADPAKKFKDIIDRMGDASTRLKGSDAGEVTQEVERRIVLDLDVLIDMAKKSQSSGKGKPDQSKDKAQKPQMSQGQKQGGKPNMGGTEAAESSQMRDGTASANPGADMHEKSVEGWGDLPQKERALITQAQQDNFLPSYRAMIERYYEELARLNRQK